MAQDSKNSIARTSMSPLAVEMPAHLVLKDGEKVAGIENTQHLVRPPYLKIVQKQSNDELQEAFGIGSAVMMPDGVVIAAQGVPFHVVPLYSFIEYVKWAPIEQKGKMPMILERSIDDRSKLASLCRERTTWKEEIDYPGVGKVTVRNCEHIVFILALVDHPSGPKVFSVSFARGEYRSGLALNAAIKQRRTHAYNCVFSLTVEGGDKRKNEKGSWRGLDVNNPAEGISPWCTEAQSKQFEALYLEAKRNHEKGLLSISLDEDQGDFVANNIRQADDGGTAVM